jgi:hypothetical protein
MADLQAIANTFGSHTGTLREKQILKLVLTDKLYPSFLNKERFQKVVIVDGVNTIELFVSPDYVSIGDDTSWLRMPMYPTTAQTIADAMGCLLPTKRLVDRIYAAGNIVVDPVTYRPKANDPRRDSTVVYLQNSNKIQSEILKLVVGGVYDQNRRLVVGHKKDIVLSNQLEHHEGNVAIYGWHQKKNKQPIQNLNAVDHSNSYVDYSHGVRLISRLCTVNGLVKDLLDVYQHPVYGPMLTGDSPLTWVKYPTMSLP